ncbi:DUF2958 domain-containing protein [Sphingomonas sp. ZB1N12]|uniref:DUF2958 domain-containing protein n=1 Tax=Sphingomonas arabinosi TaxID=3096160 RepID=UPI002FC5AE01
MKTWFTQPERARLLDAGANALDDEAIIPMARLFQPDGPGVWLVGELDPRNADIAYGLADIGIGVPEIGSFDLAEIATLRGALNLAVERDLSFVPRATLAELGRWATAAGRIVR